LSRKGGRENFKKKRKKRGIKEREKQGKDIKLQAKNALSAE
jgi:hypothetical protein